jgi:hypothetical protein
MVSTPKMHFKVIHYVKKMVEKYDLFFLWLLEIHTSLRNGIPVLKRLKKNGSVVIIFCNDLIAFSQKKKISKDTRLALFVPVSNSKLVRISKLRFNSY